MFIHINTIKKYMTFRQMELFIAVCEYKSINKTSEKCYISQQGISKMIRALEEELGCKLLIRSSFGVTPTKYGSYFFNECQSILEKKNFICSHINEVTDFPKETIHLGMAFGMISALSYRLISEFESEYPYVKIEYNDHTDMNLEKLHKKDTYDFCITTGLFDSDKFTYEKLFEEPVYLCIPEIHPLYLQEKITMEDIKTSQFAMFSSQFHIRHAFIQSCKKLGFEPEIAITSNDFNSLKEIAKHNGLLFIVPRHTINYDTVGFRYYPFPDESFVWNVYFTKKKNKILTDSMNNFYSFLKRKILLDNK